MGFGPFVCFSIVLLNVGLDDLAGIPAWFAPVGGVGLGLAVVCVWQWFRPARPGLADALGEAVIGRRRPFLGICVGMQLMASRGLEHGEFAGLGWLRGDVVRLAPGHGLKVPHMGWNELSIAAAHPLLAGIEDGAHMYFMHGYHLRAADRGAVLANADYGGPVTAMVAVDNLAGVQFHPEKSQAAGLRLLANFLSWTP